MSWLDVAAGAGAGLETFGRGVSYLDDEERKRRERQDELDAQLEERRAAAQQQRDTAVQTKTIDIANDEAKRKGADIRYHSVLDDIANSTTLTAEQKELARLKLNGVDVPALPKPTTPRNVRIDTVDPKTGKHVIRFVSEDEAAGQSYDAYDPPKVPAAEPLVRVETEDPDNPGQTIVQFVPRSQAAGQSYRKPPAKVNDADAALKEWAAGASKPTEPAASPKGGGWTDVLKQVWASTIGGGRQLTRPSSPDALTVVGGVSRDAAPGAGASPQSPAPTGFVPRAASSVPTSGTAPRSTAPAPNGAPTHKPGDIVTVRGRQVKISAVYPNGTFDAVDPTTGAPIK